MSESASDIPQALDRNRTMVTTMCSDGELERLKCHPVNLFSFAGPSSFCVETGFHNVC